MMAAAIMQEQSAFMEVQPERQQVRRPPQEVFDSESSSFSDPAGYHREELKEDDPPAPRKFRPSEENYNRCKMEATSKLTEILGP
jgi:hypothetical protein